MTLKATVRKGFTLIELMAVVLILAILAGVALPKFFNYQTQAKAASCKGALGGVRAGIANFYADKAVSTGTAAYPTLAELTNGSTMQEEIPDNPYGTPSKNVSAATLAEAGSRDLIGGGGGWAYYPGTAANAVFYANTDTVGINENSF